MDPNNPATQPVPAPMAPVQAPETPVQQTFQNAEPHAAPPAQPPKKKNRLVLIIALVGTLLILLSGLSVAYAYEVIPAGNKAFQESVSNTVQAIPFMPKTLTYVLKSSMKAHEKVTRFTLDASVAGSSKDSISILGSSNFDLSIVGPIDYTDLDNPMASLNAKITKDFDLDFIGKGYVSYFRINKIPSTISALLSGFLGIEEKQILNKWFYYDETPLQTDARTTLNEKNKNKNESEKIVNELFTTLKDPEVAKAITMKKESFGKLPMYHIHFAPNDQMLDMFWEKYIKNVYPESKDSSNTNDSKLSKIMTNFVFDVWVDRDTYLVRKSINTFTIKGGSSSYDDMSSLALVPTQKSDIDISVVVNLTDYGKQLEFTSPAGAIEFGEYLKTLTPTIASHSGSMYNNSVARQFSQANDTKRRSDVTMILNGIGQYTAYNSGQLPTDIAKLTAGAKMEINSIGFPNLCKQLVPTYLPALPVDPLAKDENGIELADCAKTWSTAGYFISKDTLNRITISAIYAEASSAPIEVTR